MKSVEVILFFTPIDTILNHMLCSEMFRLVIKCKTQYGYLLLFKMLIYGFIGQFYAIS